MSLDIGRKGWVGVAFESSYGSPETIDDYIPFTENGLRGMAEKIENEAAYGIRERVYNSVGGKKWGEGDIGINLDGKFVGYFLGGAFGTINSSNVAGSVYDHTFTRNNATEPKSLTVVNNRSVDTQYYRGASVKTLEINVSDGLASAKASLLSKHPITTASGSLTTASGSVFSFKDVHFAFGSSVAAAAAATNLKTSELTVTVENNSEPVFRHGSADVDVINHKEFEVSAQGTLLFENVTNRDKYYDNTKQAAAIVFTGVGIGGGYSETLTMNLYQTRLDTFELETGLSDFFAENFDLMCEYDEANDKTADAVLRNTKASY